MSFSFDQSQREIGFDNLLTGPGGSVLKYLEINYFVGRGEERSAFAVFTSCRTSRVLSSFLKGTNYFFGT